MLWRGNSTNWLTVLNERLIAAASSSQGVHGNIIDKSITHHHRGPPGGYGGVGGYADDSTSHIDPLGGFSETDVDISTGGSHTISHINPSVVGGNNRMLCAVDTLPVEIVPNGRSDLCFLAYIEEFSQVVGKADLFKRSLLLMRAWWTYEASSYVGTPSKVLLSVND